jgi:ketosteroid isomerase-like protein
MSDATVAEVRATDDARYAAMIAKDFAGLDRVLADTLVYTHSNAEADTKASYIQALRDRKYDYRKAERFDEVFQVLGDVVVMTGRARLEILAAGTPKTLNNRFITVWAKRAGAWQMTAWQSTPIPT